MKIMIFLDFKTQEMGEGIRATMFWKLGNTSTQT
jgi:hypothetical protein